MITWDSPGVLPVPAVEPFNVYLLWGDHATGFYDVRRDTGHHVSVSTAVGHRQPGRDCPACVCPRNGHDGYGCGCGCAMPIALLTPNLFAAAIERRSVGPQGQEKTP